MNRLRGLTLERLAEELGVTEKHLLDLAHTAPDRYRPQERQIGDKTRRLLVPDRDLKTFQSRFYKRYLADFPYHGAVYCCKGRGAVAAARVHRRHTHVLHLDIADFFPSVDHRRVRSAFGKVGVSRTLVPTLSRLLTAEDQLPQGAPTSVAVGNLVLLDLDIRLQGLCDDAGAGFAYTRYVDDIAISGGSRLEKRVATIRRIIGSCGWTLNTKGGLLGSSDQHHLLGLLVGLELNVDEYFLADLEAALAEMEVRPGSIDGGDLASLRGRIGWVKAVEPARGRKLEARLRKCTTETGAFADG